MVAQFTEDAIEKGTVSNHPFLPDIRSFCDWIGYDADTAYVFLFRDTLLPYVYYRKNHPQNLHPWIISRRFLADISGNDHMDDEIRSIIYDALEAGQLEFPAFCTFCRERILCVLDQYAGLKRILQSLLGSITAQKITVVESGYGGTFPMMLAALDGRVSFRMYTTAPYLYETYRDIIYCRKYEDIRKFETLYSQDCLLQYAAYENGKFYVQASEDSAVIEKSLSEIAFFTALSG